MDTETLINAVFNEAALWDKSNKSHATKKSHKDRLCKAVAEICASDGIFSVSFSANFLSYILF